MCKVLWALTYSLTFSGGLFLFVSVYMFCLNSSYTKMLYMVYATVPVHFLQILHDIRLVSGHKTKFFISVIKIGNINGPSTSGLFYSKAADFTNFLVLIGFIKMIQPNAIKSPCNCWTVDNINIPEILECQSPCACPDPKTTSPRVYDKPDHLKL